MQRKYKRVGIIIAILIFSLISVISITALDYTDYYHRYKLENNGLDDTGRLNLSNTGSPIYSTTRFKEGSYSLNASTGAGHLGTTGANNITSGNADRTFCGWYYTNATGTLGNYVVGAGVASNSQMLYMGVYMTAAKDFYVAGQANDVIWSSVSSNNIWEHFCLAYHASNHTAQLFLNGTDKGWKTFTANINMNSNKFLIGSSEAGGTSKNIWADDIRYYEFAFTNTDAIALYQSYTPSSYVAPTAPGITKPLNQSYVAPLNITWNASTFTNATLQNYRVDLLNASTNATIRELATITSTSYLWNATELGQFKIKITVTDNNSQSNSSISPTFTLNESFMITACRNLTLAGTYIVTQNISTSGAGACLHILANDITINCQGKRILGSNTTLSQGIKANHNNTKIYNCIVDDFDAPLMFYNQVDPESQRYNLTIENVSATTIFGASTNTGLEVRYYTNVLIKNTYVKCTPDDAFFFTAPINNMTLDNVTGIAGEYGASFYGYPGGAREQFNNILINNSYFRAGTNVATSAGISFLGVHDSSDNNNTRIYNTVINNTGVARPCLRTTAGSTNTIFVNNTCIGSQWVVDPASDTTYNDSTSGNRWYLNNGALGNTIFNWTDTNADGWADTGSGVPVSAATAAGYWTNNGADYHPYTTTAGPINITFVSPTPADNANYLVTIKDYINIKTNVTGVTAGNVTHRLYNSAGILISQRNYTGIADASYNWTGLEVGRYYYNATLTSPSGIAHSQTRTVAIYDIIPGDLTNEPTFNSRYANFTWNAGSTTNNSVNIISYHLLIRTYPQGDFVKAVTLGNVTNYSWDAYTDNAIARQYRATLTSIDAETNNASSSQNILLTRETQLNISVRANPGNAAINSFSGWAYHASGLNVSFSTTTGTALVDQLKGDITVFVDSDEYAITNTTNTYNANVNSSFQQIQFSLYATNAINITFYDQSTNAIINYTTTTMDLIGDLTSYNVSTTNGTLYLTLLQPSNYTMRYSAPGYDTRFYYIELLNKSYQSLNLYLLNNTISYPVNVTIIDESTNVVSGAKVKALRFDIATNTYILREVGSTTDQGKTTLQLTYNDEFYKFMVEYDGVLYLTTAPAYITSPTYQLQIILLGTTGTEYYEYASLYKNVSFLSGSNSFRLTYDDSTGTSSQVCLQIIKIGGGVVNQSCVTSSSLTINLGVTPQPGVTYTGKAYRIVDGQTEFLTSASHTYPKSTSFGRFGLFIQFIISTLVAFVVVIDIPFVLIAVPASLLIGYWFGLHQLSLVTIVVLIVVGIIIAYIVRRATQ